MCQLSGLKLPILGQIFMVWRQKQLSLVFQFLTLCAFMSFEPLKRQNPSRGKFCQTKHYKKVTFHPFAQKIMVDFINQISVSHSSHCLINSDKFWDSLFKGCNFTGVKFSFFSIRKWFHHYRSAALPCHLWYMLLILLILKLRDHKSSFIVDYKPWYPLCLDDYQQGHEFKFWVSLEYNQPRGLFMAYEEECWLVSSGRWLVARNFHSPKQRCLGCVLA